MFKERANRITCKKTRVDVVSGLLLEVSDVEVSLANSSRDNRYLTNREPSLAPHQVVLAPRDQRFLLPNNS